MSDKLRNILKENKNHHSVDGDEKAKTVSVNMDVELPKICWDVLDAMSESVGIDRRIIINFLIGHALVDMLERHETESNM